MTTLPAEQLFNMPLAVLLGHADRVKFLRELGVRLSNHRKYSYLCIHNSSTSIGYNVRSIPAKRIINKALTSYKHLEELKRERQETNRRLERERASEVADLEATVRFKLKR